MLCFNIEGEVCVIRNGWTPKMKIVVVIVVALIVAVIVVALILAVIVVALFVAVTFRAQGDTQMTLDYTIVQIRCSG